MAIKYICDGCSRPLEQTQRWLINAVRLLPNGGQDIELELCDFCIKLMKDHKVPS